MRGSLGTRLAVALVGVALAAVAVLAILALLSARSEVSALVERQRDDTAAAIAAALADAYEDAGSWAASDIRPAYALALTAGASLEVRDEAGDVVWAPGAHMGGMMGRLHGMGTEPTGALGEPRTLAISTGAADVGTAVVRFPAAAPPAESQVRDALARTVLLGSALAALLALVVAAVVSRRITTPLRRLTGAVREMERGNRDARANVGAAPGELGELAHAFDRMADALEREDAHRRSLVADVAHELRTPLTILQASCEELIDGEAAATPERLVSLHDEVLRLARLVADLETLSAAQVAGLQLESAQVDLAQVASEAADRLGPALAAAELTLDRRLERAEVPGDRARLSQIAANLLGNALKFTPPGGSVLLETGQVDARAFLRVSDTGPGIPAEELPHVFERFWRGERAAGIAGSGIGLAVVSELVRAHGGEVEAASPDGRGAIFTVLLPELAPQSPPHHARAEAVSGVSTDGG